MVSRNHGVDDGLLPSRLVAFQAFFRAVALTLFAAVAVSLFLQTNGPDQLPYVYLLAAGGVALAHRAYLFVEYRIPIGASVLVALIGGTSLIGGAWAMVSGLAEDDGWVLYTALGLVPVVAHYLTKAEDNQLDLFYDLRQLNTVTPRVLILAAAGSAAAAIVLPPVLVVAPLDGLLALAAVAALLATGVGLLLIVNYASIFSSRPALDTGRAPQRLRSRTATGAGLPEVARDRFVRLVMLHELMRTTTACLILFLFLDGLYTRLFDDPGGLAITVAATIAGTSIVGTALRILASRTTLLRFGLRFGLVVGPGLVGLVVAGLLLLPAAGVAVEETRTGLGVVAAIWALERVFNLAASEPSVLVTKRIIPERLRFAGSVGIEGVAPPVGAVLAGVVLLLVVQGADLTEGTVGVMVGIACGFWLLTAVLISNRYRVLIDERLATPSLAGLDVPVETAESQDVAMRLVDGSSSTDRRLGLDMLAAVGERRYHVALLRLLETAEDRSTLLDVIDRVNDEKLGAAVEPLKALLDEGRQTDVRVAAMAALVACEPYGGGETLEPLLESEERAIKAGAVLALLKGAVLRHHDVALNALNELANSPMAEDRSEAAVILGRSASVGHRELLANLLVDADVEVRAAAIEAVGLLDLSGHTPSVLAALGEPRARAAATGAVARFGNGAIPAATEALADPAVDEKQAVRIVRAVAAAPSHGATSLLGAMLASNSAAVRAACISGLVRSPYLDSGRLTLPARMNRMIRPVLDAEAGRVEELFGVVCSVPDGSEFELLKRAVCQQAESHAVNVFNLLAIRYRRPELAATNGQILNGGRSSDLAKKSIDSVAADRDRLLVAALLGQRRRANPGAHGPDGDLDRVLRTCDDDWTAATAVYGAALAGRTGAQEPEKIRRPDNKVGPLHREALSWHRRRVIAKAAGTPHRTETEQNGRKIVMPMVEKVDLLRRCAIFAETPDRSLVDIADTAERLTVGPGDPLLSAGEPVEALFVVVSGELEAVIGGTTSVHGPNDVIGEFDILRGAVAAVDVSAKTTVEVLSLGRTALQTLIERRPELAEQVIRALAEVASSPDRNSADPVESAIDLTESASPELSASADLS